MKTCTKCKSIKALTEFYKRSASPDNLTYWCGQCLKDNHRSLRKNRIKVADFVNNFYNQ